MPRPENPDHSRQDQADARANQMDTRSNQMDVRSGKVDRRQDQADEHTTRIERVITEQDKILENVLQALLDAAKSLEGVEDRMKAGAKELREERERDKGFLRMVTIVALLALFASAMGSLAAYSTCQGANETRDTIRIIIAASPNRGQEMSEARKEFQRIVDSRTKPLNCANPITYFVRQ